MSFGGLLADHRIVPWKDYIALKSIIIIKLNYGNNEQFYTYGLQFVYSSAFVIFVFL